MAWAAVAQTYSQKGNDAHAFELRKRLQGSDQNNRSRAEYYAKLNEAWQELDYYQGFHPLCTTEATTFQNLVENAFMISLLALI